MLQHCKQYSVQLFLSTWFRAKHVRATLMTEIKKCSSSRKLVIVFVVLV